MSLLTFSDISFWTAITAYSLTVLATFGHLAWKTKNWQRVSAICAGSGLTAHLLSLGAIALALERAPWGSLYEFLSAVSALLMIVTVSQVLPKPELTSITGVLTGVAVMLMGIGALLYAEPTDLQPALQSGWLAIHVFLAIVGSGSLLSAATVSFLYLRRLRYDEQTQKNLTDRRADSPITTATASAIPSEAPAFTASVPDHTFHRSLVTEGNASSVLLSRSLSAAAGKEAGTALLEKNQRDTIDPTKENTDNKQHTKEAVNAHKTRLPSAKRLDTLAHRLVTFSFPIWTLAVLMGAVWGEQAWGRYWGWDPKETMSFIIWVLFAGYLHARATRGWKGKRSAVLACWGGGAILFNFLFVNLVISGLHSYSGF